MSVFSLPIVMGGALSTDCQHGTHDVTKWYQTSRRCAADSGYKLKSHKGSRDISKGLSGDNCNIQHAGDDCWGIYDRVSGAAVYCLDDKWAVMPGPISDDWMTQQQWWEGACRQGCDGFCPDDEADVSEEITCWWDGPKKGEISAAGDALSEAMSLEAAKSECSKHVDCVGVDSPWYIGTNYTARAGTFREDRGSYGLTYLKRCDSIGPLPPLSSSGTGMTNSLITMGAGAACCIALVGYGKKKKQAPKEIVRRWISNVSGSFGGGRKSEIEMGKGGVV
jgi:hypothetical protein